MGMVGAVRASAEELMRASTEAKQTVCHGAMPARAAAARVATVEPVAVVRVAAEAAEVGAGEAVAVSREAAKAAAAVNPAAAPRLGAEAMAT